MRTALATLSLLMFLAFAPSRATAQETAMRFPVAGVSDTTFTFRVGEQRWVQAGQLGMVVDPREQDVLVARFRIASVRNGVARAVVTGQTASVATTHMVLLDVPATPWYRERFLWIGAAAGAVVGFLLGQI